MTDFDVSDVSIVSVVSFFLKNQFFSPIIGQDIKYGIFAIFEEMYHRKRNSSVSSKLSYLLLEISEGTLWHFYQGDFYKLLPKKVKGIKGNVMKVSYPNEKSKLMF